MSEFSSDFHFCVSFKSVTLQHEETQEQPEILLTLTRFQQLHISTTPLLQPVQVTAADGNPICSRAIQQSTTTCKPRGRPRRYMSSASGATHAEPVTFRPATHTAPHQRTLSLNLQTEHLITIPCFSFLYSVFILSANYRALLLKSLSVICYVHSCLIFFYIYCTCAFSRCQLEYRACTT